jgi:hypothetical protein
MIVTPTNTGSVIAGVGVGIFGWSLAEKGDRIPFVKRLYTHERKERMFTWASGNKTMALVALEGVNFGIHGITDANGVLFALGNTLVNVLGLWIYLPLRQRRANRARTQAVLQGEGITSRLL